MKRVGLLVIGVVLLLAGCQGEKHDYENEVESVEYKVSTGLAIYGSVVINTVDETLVITAGDVDFVRGKDDKTKVRYTRDKKGEVQEVQVYIGKSDIKQYSKKYAKEVGTTMKILEEGK